MTNIEYITATLGRFGVEPSLMEVALANHGLSPDDDVDVERIKLALYNEIPSCFPGLESISEGGLSYRYNTDGLKLWYAQLCKQLGLENVIDPSSEIVDRTNFW